MDPLDREEKASLQGKYQWVWGTAFAFITIVTVAIRYALPVRDGDVWWHMLYGKYFLENKTLIADHTIFSWTQSSNDTIYCTWLPDIFLYLLHQAGGLPALFAFRYFCLYFFVLACFLYARKVGKGADPLAWLVILVGILMAYAAVFIKPEIISFVLMTLLAWNWWHIRSGGDNAYRWCYGFPVIMVVWVNTHGAFVFGIIFLVAVAVGEIMNTWWSHGNALPGKVRKHLCIALSLTALMPLLNPYGWHYPYRLFFDLLPTPENLAYNKKISSYITTFEAGTKFHDFSLYANIAVAIVAGLSLVQLKQKKAEWSLLMANMVFALLYSRYFRTTFYLAPVFAFSSIYMVSSISFGYCRYYYKKYNSIIMLFALLSISSYSIYYAFEYPEGDVVVGDFGIACINPVDEAEYVKQYYPQARIGNSYNFGAYLLWKLWPENKVFFDARHFPYKDWSDDYFLARSAAGLSELLAKYPAEVWVFDHTEVVLSSYFRYSSDWKLAFYGKCGEVFVARDIPLPEGQETFRVAESIGAIKSRYTVYNVFLFALSVYDWETAGLLLKRIEDWYLNTHREKLVFFYRDMLAGMKAFAERDYANALDKLAQFNAVVGGVGGYVVISHLNLAQQAMDNKQFDSANSHVRTALFMLPDTFYTQFNAALVARLVSRQKALEGGGAKQPAWKEGFRNFLRLVVGNEDFFKEEVNFARAVLADAEDVEERYELLVPELKNFVGQSLQPVQ